MKERQGPMPIDRGILLSVICLFAYTAFPQTQFASGDIISTSFLPFSILRLHSAYLGKLLINAGVPLGYWVIPHGIHYVSRYPIGAALTALPFYLPYVFFGGGPTKAAVVFLGWWSSAFISAMSVYFVYRSLRVLKVDRTWQVIGTLLYGVGTETFSISSQGLWQHGPAEMWISLFLLTSFVLALMDSNSKTIALVGGLSFGMTLISRPPDLLLILPVGFWLARDLIAKQKILQMACLAFGAGVVVLPILYYNYKIFGGPMKTGYGGDYTGMFSYPLPFGVIGNLFSPSKGLLIYSPVLLFAFAWPLRLKGIRDVFSRKSHLIPVIVGFCMYLLLYSLYYQWPAGWVFGPRYMADASPSLIILSVVWLDGWFKENNSRTKRRSLWIVICLFAVWSVFLQMLGVYVPAGGAWNAGARPNTFLGPLWSIQDSEPVFYFNSFLASFRNYPEISEPKVDFHALRILNKPFIYKKGRPVSSFAPNTTYHGEVTAVNTGTATWPAFVGKNGVVVHFSYLIFKNGKVYNPNGERSALLHSVDPGGHIRIYFAFATPAHPGNYTYVFTLVQEGVRWFQNSISRTNAVVRSIYVK